MKYIYREENIDRINIFAFLYMSKDSFGEGYNYLEINVREISTNKSLCLDYVKITPTQFNWHPRLIDNDLLLSSEARLNVEKAWKNRAFL